MYYIFSQSTGLDDKEVLSVCSELADCISSGTMKVPYTQRAVTMHGSYQYSPSSYAGMPAMLATVFFPAVHFLPHTMQLL